MERELLSFVTITNRRKNMKKLTRILALFLCVVLLAFAFASCGKKNNDATSADTTAPTTTPTTSLFG